MAPFYRGYDPTFQLDVDDVQGIQALYGKKTRNTGFGGGGGGEDDKGTDFDDDNDEDEAKNGGGKKVPAEDLILCKDSKIDTIFTSAEGKFQLQLRTKRLEDLQNVL